VEYKIREIKNNEFSLLENFLYEAIFIPKGILAPSKEIIKQPELQLYIANFGEKDSDIGLVAEVEGRIIGAVWARIMDDFGHIDDKTPSLAISLYEDFRNYGIGTALMDKILIKLKKKGFK